MGAKSVKLLLLGILILLFDVVLALNSAGIGAFIIVVAVVGLLVGMVGFFTPSR